jgi:hypothetical protein
VIATDRQFRTDFLSGTGEMGALIRAYDWEDTPLGPIEAWPSSLKTSVSLILNSRHPMWIGWGWHRLKPWLQPVVVAPSKITQKSPVPGIPSGVSPAYSGIRG